MKDNFCQIFIKTYVVGAHENHLGMSTHNIGFYEAILMSTPNIGFYEEISKIIPYTLFRLEI